MRIGLDFDNTIIRYDDVFQSVAKQRGLVPADFSGTKQQVRDAIRLLPDGEIEWQKLQGYVYGKGIGGASMFPGLDAFLRRAGERGDSIAIVSHKTRYGHYDPDRVDLREAALAWMKANRFFETDIYGMRVDDVYFATTRAEKLDRIASLAFDAFVDDLEEVLTDPDFPTGPRRILFSSHAEEMDGNSITVCPDWPSVQKELLS